MKNILLFFCCCLGYHWSAHAQSYKIELRLTAAALLTTERMVDQELVAKTDAQYLPVTSAELYYFVKPKIGVGLFYMRSFFENGEFEAPSFDEEFLANYQHYGLALLYSTKRDRRVQLNVSAGILKAEQVVDFEHFATARTSIGYVAGLGMVLKISRSISFNVINARMILYGDDFRYYEGTRALGAMADSGFIFKFLREK